MADQNSLFDVATGVMVRDWLKHIINWGLNRAERKAPKLFYTLAWMHLRAEGAQAKAWFQGTIIVAGTWVDWLAGNSKMFGQFKEVIESTFQDMTGSFSAYFERREHNIKIPDDFSPPQLNKKEDVDAIVREFQTFLGQELQGDLPSALEAIKTNKKGSAAERLTNLLVRCNDPFMIWAFKEYFISLTEEKKGALLLAAQHIDDPDELVNFTRHPDDVKDLIIDMARRSHQLAMIPRLTRLARENWPKFNELSEQFYAVIATEIGRATTTVEAENDIRRLEIQARRNGRVAERRADEEKKKNRRFAWFWSIPFWIRLVVGGALVFALGSVLMIKGCEMASNSRKAKDAERNTAIAAKDSLDQVFRAMNASKERYDDLVDSLRRAQPGFARDSASTWRP